VTNFVKKRKLRDEVRNLHSVVFEADLQVRPNKYMFIQLNKKNQREICTNKNYFRILSNVGEQKDRSLLPNRQNNKLLICIPIRCFCSEKLVDRMFPNPDHLRQDLQQQNHFWQQIGSKGHHRQLKKRVIFEIFVS
jgi:hypothetical protein